MITAISIRNFKSIKAIEKLKLESFHVLVGANGSGKTSFMEAINFVRDCVISGFDYALEKRYIRDFNELTWDMKGGDVNIDLFFNDEEFEFVYRFSIGKDGENFAFCESITHNEVEIYKVDTKKNEYFALVNGDKKSVYPQEPQVPVSPLLTVMSAVFEDIKIIKKLEYIFYHLNYLNIYACHLRNPILPSKRWVVGFGLNEGYDGSNLPRLLGRNMPKPTGNGFYHNVYDPNPDSPIGQWTRHLQLALPNLEAVGWSKLPHDNSEYLTLKYKNGLEVPSWILSDGTLRLLALTFPAFIPAQQSLYMIEEPENGVHPYALDVILNALQTLPNGQAFVATHSPHLISQVGKDALLCFTHTDEEGTKVIRGSDHPHLNDWDGTPDLGFFFAQKLLE